MKNKNDILRDIVIDVKIKMCGYNSFMNYAIIESLYEDFLRTGKCEKITSKNLENTRLRIDFFIIKLRNCNIFDRIGNDYILLKNDFRLYLEKRFTEVKENGYIKNS